MRSNQPCSMSRARFAPAAPPAKPAPCRHASGTIHERYDVVGKPSRCVRRPNWPAFPSRKTIGAIVVGSSAPRTRTTSIRPRRHIARLTPAA